MKILWSLILVLLCGTASSQVITRGPYLQNTTSNAVTIRWRTDIATNTKAEVGPSTSSYTISSTDGTATTEHEIRVTGLSPDTKYFYRIGTIGTVLEGTANNFFRTSPPASTKRKIKVAVFGDCGKNANNNQTMSLQAYRNYVGADPAELMLLLGDNAYTDGFDWEYQNNFFNAYGPTILKNHNLFPAPGNHDYAGLDLRQADKNIAYYDIFTMPKNGEGGGVASNTESYYSFNWGNIHFMSLDSYGFETAAKYRLYDTMSPQVNWIKADLAANTSKWTVVYWHHAPHTMSSHNSDIEDELIAIRQNFIRILERYGVDLIMCGHSHAYERSYFLNGYYGTEPTFNVNSHALTTSSGKYDGSDDSCPYVKTTSDKRGTVYMVSGSAGASGTMDPSFPHSALPFSLNDGGMFYFEVEDNRLDGKFLRKDGTVWDKFTIMKDVNDVKEITTRPGEAVTLTASWVGSYNWSTGATTRSITVTPMANTTYTVSDPSLCIADQYSVSANAVLPVNGLNFSAKRAGKAVILDWSTESEKNADGFQVQHSINGREWNAIGWVKAAGSTNTRQRYNLTHGAPAVGMNYYRLLERDMDGRVSYSATKAINVELPDQELLVLGNPVTNGELKLQASKAVIAGLYSTDGRLLATKKLSVGLNSWDLSWYSKGVYFLSTSDNATTPIRIMLR